MANVEATKISRTSRVLGLNSPSRDSVASYATRISLTFARLRESRRAGLAWVRPSHGAGRNMVVVDCAIHVVVFFPVWWQRAFGLTMVRMKMIRHCLCGGAQFWVLRLHPRRLIGEGVVVVHLTSAPGELFPTMR